MKEFQIELRYTPSEAFRVIRRKFNSTADAVACARSMTAGRDFYARIRRAKR